MNFSGLITDVTGRYITITDTDTLKKLHNVLDHKKYENFKKPFTTEGYKIKLMVRTKITSASGREDLSCLPDIMGWRCTGKVRLKHWAMKSKYFENYGEQISGITLVCDKIHLGS